MSQSADDREGLMKPRIAIITIAVDDLEKALAFYRDGMGLPTPGIIDGADHVAFDLAGGLSLVLYPRAELAKQAQQPQAGRSSAEFSLSYVAGSKAEVDAVLRRAEAAGATLLDAPQEESWGYIGFFKDLDGHLWEVLWGPGFET